jgi:hypothetical protein
MVQSSVSELLYCTYVYSDINKLTILSSKFNDPPHSWHVQSAVD